MNLLAIDTETTLLPPPQKIRTHFHVPTLVCAQTCSGDAPQLFSSEDHGGLRDALSYACADGGVLCGHNLAFDVAALANASDDLREVLVRFLQSGNVLDTRVLWCLLEPSWRGSRSLGAACDRFLGISLEKGAVRTSFVPGQPLTEEQRAYALQDAKATYDLAVALTSDRQRPPQPSYFHRVQVYADVTRDFLTVAKQFSTAAAWLGLKMEPRGISFDRERLEHFLRERRESRLRASAILRDGGLAEFVRRPRSPVFSIPYTDELAQKYPGLCRKWTFTAGSFVRVKGQNVECADADTKLNLSALRAVFFEFAAKHDITAPVSEKTKALSLEYDFWKQYRALMPPYLEAYLDYAKASKALSVTLEPLNALKTDRVYPSYFVAFAETGRWTSARPNFQNQERALRSMYRASPGHLLISADYKALEMYTAAEAFARLGLGGGPLARLLDSGEDPHRATAVRMFGVASEKVSDEQRLTAKIANFSLLGGMGPLKLLKKAKEAGLKWTLETAQEMRERWFTVISDAKSFLELFRVDPWSLCPTGWDKRQWLLAQDIPTYPWPSRFELSRKLNGGNIYEVRLPSGRVIPDRGFSQAANVFFQGLGAEVISGAFARVCAAGLEPVAVVHDSITVEATEGEAEEATRVLVGEMLAALGEVVKAVSRLPAPEVHCGTHWK